MITESATIVGTTLAGAPVFSGPLGGLFTLTAGGAKAYTVGSYLPFAAATTSSSAIVGAGAGAAATSVASTAATVAVGAGIVALIAWVVYDMHQQRQGKWCYNDDACLMALTILQYRGVEFTEEMQLKSMAVLNKIPEESREGYAKIIHDMNTSRVARWLWAGHLHASSNDDFMYVVNNWQLPEQVSTALAVA